MGGTKRGGGKSANKKKGTHHPKRSSAISWDVITLCRLSEKKAWTGARQTKKEKRRREEAAGLRQSTVKTTKLSKQTWRTK